MGAANKTSQPFTGASRSNALVKGASAHICAVAALNCWRLISKQQLVLTCALLVKSILFNRLRRLRDSSPRARARASTQTSQRDASFALFKYVLAYRYADIGVYFRLDERDEQFPSSARESRQRWYPASSPAPSHHQTHLRFIVRGFSSQR